MTPERILQKLARRSSPGTEYIAANYTVADLTNDLLKLAMTKPNFDDPTGRNEVLDHVSER